jgi:hypothetical protein
MSNILIIGNGFDIYHGLPTRYNDFLFLAEYWDTFYAGYSDASVTETKNEMMDIRLDRGKLYADSLIDYVKYKPVFDNANIQYLNEHVNTNAWIKYFLEIKFSGKGWVDFETEIDKVLHAIDLFFDELPNNVGGMLHRSQVVTSDIRSIVQKFLPLSQDKFDIGFFGHLNASLVEPPKLREHRLYLLDKLRVELDVLNECLRLYLLEFVSKIKCNTYSEQVQALGDVQLLNFNYTYTYQYQCGCRKRLHHQPRCHRRP